MAGRPRKPIALTLVANGGKLRARDRQRAEQEPHVESAIGDPPEYFTEAQRAVWRRVVAAAPPGLLTALDHDLLANFALIAAACHDAAALFNATKGQLLVRSPDAGRLVLNPLLREHKRLAELLVTLGRELGMGPVARTRIALPLETPEDPLLQFLKPLP